ncbi:TPA: hypothetical protein ACGSTO_000790 [Vibrio parahaemolyticus]
MAQEQSMWGSIWDGVLETGGELLTDVTDLGKDWLGVKIENEAQRVESSNPDEQRKHNNDYQQPTGEPVYTSAFAGGDNHAPYDGRDAVRTVVIGGVLRR